MSISYLLDTSALRALPSKVLQNASHQHAHLFVSPYCFWEILCHLDEQGNFDYYKALLMKLKYVTVLDDPYATCYASFLPNDPELQERVTDDDLIYPMVSALHTSDSLRSFYSRYVRDRNGRKRQIADCASRVRHTLDRHETRYTQFIHDIIQAFQSEQLDLDTDEHAHQRILELIEGEVIKLLQKNATKDGLQESVIEHFYIYYSYIFHRALTYYKSGTTTIDQNDYEDSKICLHLTLRTPYKLMTVDKRMKTALEETISLLQSLNIQGFQTTLHVTTIDALQLQ